VLMDWKQLAIAPREVQGDRDLMLGALMTSQGAALQYAAPELRADRKVVLEATKYFGTAFREASSDLRGDREFALEAIALHGAALSGAADSLRGDRSLVLEAARRGHGSCLEGATKDLKTDQEFVLEVAAADPQAVKHASEELLNNRDFALRLVETSGRALQYLPPRFKADREIVTAAVGENVAAALFAHTSRREDMGLILPWDGQAQLKSVFGKPGVAEEARPTGGAKAGVYQEGVWYTHMKAQKMIQFSAFSTMMGNMGQGNYTGANFALEMLPRRQRPEIDAVALMWGAVGNIGMRWKAFASQDMLNMTPELLLTIEDASKILHLTCCKMQTPENYAGNFMDIETREYMIAPNSGGGTGGGWKPSEDAGVQPIEWRADGLGKGFLLGKDLDDERAPKPPPQPEPTRGGAPLGGWPGLVGLGGEPAQRQRPPRPRYPLELGARVELVGLSSKNGITGILVKSFADGRWKVRLEDGSGNALLKGCYLQAIKQAAEVAKEEGAGELGEAAASASELRRANLEQRRCRMKERGIDRREAHQQVAACA